MNEIVNEENIASKIYEIRGVQVMLDVDLAKLYHCKYGTKDINRSVKNNLDKFPERFSWILSDIEENNLRLKNLTTSISTKSRTNPRVFTEQGVAMLATILKTEVAIMVSISIMDAFVSMRRYISNNLIEQNYINNLVKKYQQQYHNLEISVNNTFHDRFIILDQKILYHSGASFKDLGNKCFAINLVDDKKILKEIILEALK